MKKRFVLGVDGGGNKTDVLVVDAGSGEILGSSQGPGCAHQVFGVDAAKRVLVKAVDDALDHAGVPADLINHAGVYLSGIDLPEEQALFQSVLSVLPWGSQSLTVDNDLFALMRSGTLEPDALAIVCGSGINGALMRGDGEIFRMLSLGNISGDWGGGLGMVEQALWYAARGEDGRGESTALRNVLLNWTGMTSIHDVATSIYLKKIQVADWIPNLPDIFRCAHEGDKVAIALIQRQAEEIVQIARALIKRAGLQDASLALVLGGGVITARDPLLMGAIERLLALQESRVRVIIPKSRPVIGAALLALESIGADQAIVKNFATQESILDK